MAEQNTNGLVIHISSLNDRSTEVVMLDRITIGASEDCDVKIRALQGAAATSNAPLIELARLNGVYRIASLDPNVEIKFNGRPVKSNKGINDGDEIWIGPSGPSIHFFPIASSAALVPGRRGGAHVAPFIEQAAMEASATARRDDAKIFLREFTRELVREINPSTKIITFAILILALLGALYIGYAQFSEARRSRKIIAEQQAQLAAQQEELKRANGLLGTLVTSNQAMLKTLSLGELLRADYGAGVCLISGSYMFVEAGTGRPLRYPETQANESGGTVQSGTEPPVLTPEGHGVIAEYEFVGTGFHVGNGFVVTNRHVVQAGQREDVAVCTIDAKDLPPKVPVLPLEKDSDSVAIGKLVVTMGYPSGLDRLLAMLDENEARQIQARYGSVESQLSSLAQNKHIQPLTTQGNITALDANKIVYDARTGEGGSGGPLFGPSGRVIGITNAIFTENTASNFAVPIRPAVALLERAGWTVPASLEPEQKEGANISQTNTRATQANGPR